MWFLEMYVQDFLYFLGWEKGGGGFPQASNKTLLCAKRARESDFVGVLCRITKT